MKYIVISLILVCFSISLEGQIKNVTNEFNSKIEKQVNEELWKQFKKAYESRDSKLFNSLHTDDVMRITPNGIRVGNEYKDLINSNYLVKDAPKREIDFWIEHRIYTGNNGYEIGYFRISSTTDGKTNEYYGRFSVVLRKVEGKWLIAQDWDTDQINGRAITAEDFAKGKILPLKN